MKKMTDLDKELLYAKEQITNNRKTILSTISKYTHEKDIDRKTIIILLSKSCEIYSRSIDEGLYVTIETDYDNPNYNLRIQKAINNMIAATNDIYYKDYADLIKNDIDLILNIASKEQYETKRLDYYKSIIKLQVDLLNMSTDLY